MSLHTLFGTALRQLRRTRKLSQAELAEAAELSVDMIGRLERGVTGPSFESIEALAKALRVPPVALFGARGSESTRGGERGKVLAEIDRTLSALNDAELKRLGRMIKAYGRE